MLDLFLAAAAVVTAPVQPSPPAVAPASAATTQPALDPERLALAREVVQAFLPPGAVQKMMSSMTNARTGMMNQMMQATPKDFGAKGAKNNDKTLGELMRERDPYFEERMAITNRVMMEELGKVMVEFEPELRETMARMYARRFTKTELTDLAAFLRTPSGSSFASQLMLMMSDPDYQEAMKKLGPKIMQAMPEIMQKVEKATAGLPPPKDPEKAKAKTVPTT